MVSIFLDKNNTKISNITILDQSNMTVNGFPTPRPQGPEGAGVQFNVQLWITTGNSISQTEIANLFQPKQKTGWQKFLDKFQKLATGQGGGSQPGGIAMFDEDGRGSHSYLPAAEFFEIMNNSGGLTGMLGLGGGPEKGLLRELGQHSIPWFERIPKLIEGVKNAGDLTENIINTGKALDDASKKEGNQLPLNEKKELIKESNLPRVEPEKRSFVFWRTDDLGSGSKREKANTLQKGAYVTDSVFYVPGTNGSTVDTFKLKQPKKR